LFLAGVALLALPQGVACELFDARHSAGKVGAIDYWHALRGGK
jgi:hypothetical protein